MNIEEQGGAPAANAELWQQSAREWVRFVDEGDENRTHLLDGPMLEACGKVDGLKVLDVGCGEGRFARMLSERGAEVFGVDFVPEFALEAKRRRSGKAFAKGRGEAIPFRSDAFDLVVSYVVLCHVPDYPSMLRELCRVCKPAGRVVLSNMSSIATAVAGYRSNPQGDRQFYLHPYFRERGGWIDAHGVRVLQFHRPLDRLFRVFLDSGMELLDYREPSPSVQQIAQRPNLIDATRIPYFFIMEWWKPD